MKKSLGEKLRELREERGWTQIYAAKIFDITNGALSNYERDERMPDAKMLKKFAEVYEVSIDYLMGADTPAPADKEPALDDEQIKEIKEKFPNLFTLLARAKGPIPEILADQITDIAKTLLKEYLENEGKKDPEKGK